MMRDENRLLVSDSLKDVITDLTDEEINALSATMIVASMEILYDGKIEVVSGKLLGLSYELGDNIRIDIHIELKRAYEFIKKYKVNGLSCRVFYLHLGNDEIVSECNFKISSAKIFDFDQQMTTCTLAVDLIKD
jgi:hypothetical protein